MSSNWGATRRFTAGGIRYRLLEGYPRLSYTEESLTAEEQYLIRASDLEAFFLESIPPPVVLFNTVIWPARRRLPGSSVMVTKEVSGEPFTSAKPGDPFSVDTGAPNYSDTYDPLYRISIKYEATRESDEDRDETDPETFLDHSVSAGGQFMNLPAASMDSAGEDPPPTDDPNYPVEDYPQGPPGTTTEAITEPQIGITKVIPTVEHTLKWSFVIKPKWDRIYGALGTVNSKSISIFHNAPTDTVLFMGVSGTQKYLWSGRNLSVAPWSLDFKFSQRSFKDGDKQITWQHYYRPKTKKWEVPLRNGTDLIYRRYNHLDLFKD
jgi:hypothetical protein